MPKLKAEFQKTKLTLCNTNYIPLGVLTNKTHLSAHNIMLSQAVNDTATLSFDIAVGGLINTDSTELLIKHKNEYYVIKEIEMSNSEQAVAKVRAEHIACELKGIMVGYFEELIGETPNNMWDTVVTNSTMAEVINSKYVFETNIVNTFRYLSSEDEKSVFEYLITIAQQFDACILFSTDTYGVIHINLLYGDIDRGRFVRKGKDLKQLDLTFNTEALFTKMTPFGATDDDGVEVTIMDVNDGKSYLTNYNYYLSKGMTMDEISSNPLCNQECVYRNEDIDDPTELLRLATDELEKISQPVVDGNISTIDLNAFEGSLYLTPILCEKIIAIDKDTNYAISCRVTSVDYNYENPLETQIGISNVIRYNSTLKDLVHQGNILDKVITNGENGKPNINASKVHGIIDGHIAQLKYSMEDSVTDVTDAVVLFENRIEGDKMFGALAIGARGILISTKIDPVTNQWVWTTAIDAKGMSTQVINAVTINGSQIKGDIISSFDEKTWINLDNGTFNFADKITYDGTTFQIKLSDGTDVEDWMKEYENSKEVLESELEEVKDKMDNLDTILDDSFTDGIITEVERNRIEDSLRQLNREKQDIDQRYDAIYSDVNLIGAPKTNLERTYGDFNTKYNNLISVISGIIADDKATDTEKSSYNTALDDYNATIPPLTTAFDNAIKTISSNDAKTQIGDLEDVLNGDIKNVSDSLDSLEETMTTSFRDGIITEAEYNTIKENITRLDAEKNDITKNYEHLSTNPNLEETVLDELTDSYDKYLQKHSALIEYVNDSIGDRVATEAEIGLIRALLDKYDEALANYRVSQTKAVNSIAEMTAENNLNEYKKLVSKDVQDVNKRITDLTLDIGGAVTDGILEEAELLIIENSIRELEREKRDIDIRYDAIKSNSNISTSFRDNTLLRKYNAFNTAHNDLINAINNMVDDSTPTESEKTAFEGATTLYNITLGELSKTFDDAINDISRNMSNAIMEALKTELQENINDVQGSVNDLNGYIETSFRDGILSGAEKETIRTHLRTLATEKKDVDKQYDSLDRMDDLTGWARTLLTTAYDEYIIAYDSLVTSINNILAKTTITASDRESLNTAFTTHDTKLGEYSKRVSEAIEAIAEKKKQDLSSTVSAKIATLEDAINLRVKTETLTETLNGYYTKTETDNYINLSKEGILSSVSSSIQQTVDNIAIGGRNFIRQSDFRETYRWNAHQASFTRYDWGSGYIWYLCVSSTSGGIFQRMTDNHTVFEKDNYVFSLYLKGVNGSTVRFGFEGAEEFTTSITDTWVRYKVVLPKDRFDAWRNKTIIIYCQNAGYFDVAQPKLEKGNKATDWTPAPEEINDKLTYYATTSELEQTSNAITAKFTSSGGYNLVRNGELKNGAKFWYGHEYNLVGSNLNRWWQVQNNAWTGYEPALEVVIANMSSGEYGVCQTIKTVVGRQYVLTCYLAGHRGNYSVIVRGTTSETADWLAHKYYGETYGGSNPNDWHRVVIPFVAQRTDTIIEFNITSSKQNITNNTHLWVKRVMVCEGTVWTPFVPHSSEIYEGITKIDQDGIRVSHSNINTKSRMSADGFSILDENNEAIAWLTSKNTWTEVKADNVYANNIDNIYMGDANLYVDHSKGTCGSGTSSSPFNNFKALADYLQATLILKKDLVINVTSTGNVTDNLDLRGIRGNGTIRINLAKTLVLNDTGASSAFYFYRCDVPITINGGRTGYDSTDGVLLNGFNYGVFFNQCKYGYVEYLAIDTSAAGSDQWGVIFRSTNGRTSRVDFCDTWNAVLADYGSNVADYDSCGNCNIAFCAQSGANIVFGSSSDNGYRPVGSFLRNAGCVTDLGNRKATASKRKAPAVPPTSDKWQSFSYRDYGYYSVGQACWNPYGKKVYQGNWENYGNNRGIFTLPNSSINTYLSGATILDGSTITLKRATSGGYSSAQTVYLCGTSHTSIGSGTPAVTKSYGKLGTLAWGEQKTFTLPKAFVTDLKAGTIKSVMFYTSDGSNYILFDTVCTLNIKVNK